MPTQILPAASLRSIPRLPAVRVRVRASNHLIWMALWSIGQAIFRVGEEVLPALREGRAARPRPISRNSGRNCPVAANHGKPMTSRRCDRPGGARRVILSVQASRQGVTRGREEDGGILSGATVRPDAPDI